MHYTLQPNEHIQLWQHAHIRILDIQTQTFQGGAQGIACAFRSSAFLCITRGNALMLLNSRTHSTNSLAIFHFPPGSRIELNAGVTGLEYVLISYEAELDSYAPANLRTLLQAYDPFNSFYNVAPAQSSSLKDMAEQMQQYWVRQQPMALFQAKALFYQWIYLIVELYDGQPDTARTSNPVELVTNTLLYMLKHYANPITLESLASAMERSSGHLSNCFKKVLNRGPIDCLIHLRMEKGLRLLADTSLTLREIATSIGYQDAYYFSNAFKKHTGISPNIFRKQQAQHEDITWQTGRNQIVAPELQCYIGIDNNNCYQYIDGGSERMFKGMRMVPVSLLLAFGLVVGGCGNSASSTATNNSSPASSVQPTTESVTETNNGAVNEGAQPAVRVISTKMGEVEVPANPKRIVTDFFLGHLLALDSKPVGSNGVFMKNPYLENQIDGITDVSDNLEAALSLEPDLIITGSDKGYEEYSKIAPTVFLDNSANVRDQIAKLGEILGKEAEAAAWLTSFNGQIEDARNRVDAILEDGETVTVFDGGITKTLTLYGNAHTGKTIHGELGMPMNENVIRDIDPKVGWLSISSEVAADYIGDHVFMAVDTKNETFDYAKDSLWGSFEAVKQNKMYEVDGYRFYFTDPISILGQVQDIVTIMEERLAENVKQ